jgi:hypothetical protein
MRLKYVKALGIAPVAAAALMAFAGAGTASASVLCKTAPNAKGNCPAGWGYEGEIHIVSTEKPILTGEPINVVCNELTINAQLSEGTKVATETPKGSIGVFTLTGECNCELVLINAGSLEIHAIGNTGNGTLTSNGTTLTENCKTIFGTVHCTYVTNNKDLGELKGGTTPSMTITTEMEREQTSSLCGTLIWHIAYKITNTPLWVATVTE